MPTKIKLTATERLYRWVVRRFQGTNMVTTRTAAALAAEAGVALGFRVNANTMCRQLRKAGVKFRATPEDPRPRNYSKADLIKARLDLMEARLRRVEGRRC